MLNIDKYKKDILQAVNTDLSQLNKTLYKLSTGEDCSSNKKFPNCRMCNYSFACTDNHIAWLFSEYEPPLLKNGDNLKPGDWILVKSSDDDDFWDKWQFLAYLDGWFYVRKVPAEGWSEIVNKFKLARLLEENE